MEGVVEPVDELASEKIALFRIYLYMPGTLYVTSTVRSECADIRDDAKRKTHDSFLSSLFDEVHAEDLGRVKQLAKNYSSFHKKENDCRILAEAEAGEFAVLLSYDFRFVSRLSSHSKRVRLLTPTKFWSELSISKGARPDKVPHQTNPIGNHTWWRW